MKLKTMLLPLAAMALAAAVFAAPAAANETYHFFHANGEPIEATPTSIHFTGPASFENESGGIACSETTAVVTFTTHQAHVTQFNGLSCETTGVLAAFCELKSPSAPESQELPWTVTPTSTSVATITGVNIDNPMKEGCIFGENINAHEDATHLVNINAETAGEIGGVNLSGSLETDIGEVEVEGHLTPTPGEPKILIGTT